MSSLVGSSKSNTGQTSDQTNSSSDIFRLSHFPSVISLFKNEPSANHHDVSPPPPPSSFSKNKSHSQNPLRNHRSSQNLSAIFGFDKEKSNNASVPIADSSLSPKTMLRTSSAATLQSPEVKTKRRSRLLDAFKSSKKSNPSFEVIRKPQPTRNLSFNSQTVPHSSSQAEVNKQQQNSQSTSASPSLNSLNFDRLVISPPSDPLPNRTGDASINPFFSLSEVDLSSSSSKNGNTVTRPFHPPSTMKTRRQSSGFSSSFGRRLSGFADPLLPPSRGPSPISASVADSNGSSFNLHSFRNVRSASEVSKSETPLAIRRQSGLSSDELFTPRQDFALPPTFVDDDHDLLLPPLSGSKPASPVRLSASFFQSQANSSSISVAKFRQAARTRSESLGVSGHDEFGVRPPPSEADKQTSPVSLTVPLPSVRRSITPPLDHSNNPNDFQQADRTNLHPSIVKDQFPAVRETSPPDPKPSLTKEPVVANRPSYVPLRQVAPASQPTNRKRGYFIVVEGLDRAGKSTQAERLADMLAAKSIKFPDRTTAIGQMINSYLAQNSDLDDKAIHLLFSANRWECVQSIRSTLSRGETIVCDRYAFSGIAYSCSKGLAYDWCRAPDIGLPLPDLTLFLDLDAETAAARGGYGEERYEELEFQAKVRESFKRVADDVRSNGGRWFTIDASKSLDQVTDDIQKTVLRVTSSIDRTNIGIGKLFIAPETFQDAVLNLGIASDRTKSASPLNSLAVDRQLSSSPVNMSASLSKNQAKHTASETGQHPDDMSSSLARGAQQPIPPLSYADQLAAVKAAAAGTFSSFFGANSTAGDEQNLAVPAVAPSALASGHGLDSARALANFSGAKTGKRMTLIELIGQKEAQAQNQTLTTASGQNPTGSKVELEDDHSSNKTSRTSSNDDLSTRKTSGDTESITTNGDIQATTKFPSTFALANRSRKSIYATEALATVKPRLNDATNAWATDSSDEEDDDEDEGEKYHRGGDGSKHHQTSKPRAGTETLKLDERKAPATAAIDAVQKHVPLVSPSPKKAASLKRASADLESAVQGNTPPLSLEPMEVLASVDESRHHGQNEAVSRGRMSLSVDQALDGTLSRSKTPTSSEARSYTPVSLPPSISPAPAPAPSPGPRPSSHDTSVGDSRAGTQQTQRNSLNPQQLAMFEAQQRQAEFQEQYMRNYMANAAMMSNPLFQHQAQAHYQMMMMMHQQQQHHHQQFYTRTASTIGASGLRHQPVAAFMQPGYGFPSSSTSEFGYPSNATQHGRNQSYGSDAEARQQQQQPPLVQAPMLSMMMAAPPASDNASAGFLAQPSIPSAAGSFMAPSPFIAPAYATHGPRMGYNSGAQSEIGYNSRSYRTSKTLIDPASLLSKSSRDQLRTPRS